MSMQAKKMIAPTEVAYSELQSAYEHFNEVLFEGVLPNCLITLQREKRSMGYFSGSRFVSSTGEMTDEIALNPEYFAARSIEAVMQTLVHEMVHLWQEHFGVPGRGRYHNKEWADKMEAIGLCPSDTHEPGGKKTGDRMGDYVISGGRFQRSCRELLTQDFRVTWADRFPASDCVVGVGEAVAAFHLEARGISVEQVHAVALKRKSQSRVKFTCPCCKNNLWGKEALNVVCGDCGVPFEMQ